MPTCALSVLGYRNDGTLIEARPVLRLRPEIPGAVGEVALRPLTTRLRRALQTAAPRSEVSVSIDEVTLKIMSPTSS